MTPPRRDWIMVVFLVIVGCMFASGLGLLGAAAIQAAGNRGQAQPPPAEGALPVMSPLLSSTPTPILTPTPTPSSSPTPRPALCWFGDFPYYPGSLAVAASAQDAEAWHSSYPASTIVTYFANGASQLAWRFSLSSHTSAQWYFRMTRAPACRGWLTVSVDPAGGTLYQVIGDRQ